MILPDRFVSVKLYNKGHMYTSMIRPWRWHGGVLYSLDSLVVLVFILECVFFQVLQGSQVFVSWSTILASRMLRKYTHSSIFFAMSHGRALSRLCMASVYGRWYMDARCVSYRSSTRILRQSSLFVIHLDLRRNNIQTSALSFACFTRIRVLQHGGQVTHGDAIPQRMLYEHGHSRHTVCAPVDSALDASNLHKLTQFGDFKL